VAITNFSSLFPTLKKSRSSSKRSRTPSALSSFSTLLKGGSAPKATPLPRTISRPLPKKTVAKPTPKPTPRVAVRPTTNPALAFARPAAVTQARVSASPRQSLQDQINQLVQSIAGQVRTPTKVLTLEDVFSQQQQDLARQTAAQRVARVLDPQLQRGLENIGGAFAGRGLFRSGIRGQEQGMFGEDIAEQRATQEAELFNIRRDEAQQELRRRQEQLEKEAAQARPTGINFSSFLR
jgi:hypothetical protein